MRYLPLVLVLLVSCKSTTELQEGFIKKEKVVKIDTIVPLTKNVNISYNGYGHFIIAEKLKGGQNYLIDTNGVRIDLEFDFDTLYIDKYKKVIDKLYCERDGLTAFYSINERKIITPFYDEVKYINDYFYRVKDSLGYEVYNFKNELLFGKDSLNKSRYVSTKQDSLVSLFDGWLYDSNGKRVTKSINVSIENDDKFINGERQFIENKHRGLLDINGDIIIRPDYIIIRPWSNGNYIVENYKVDNRNRQKKLGVYKANVGLKLDTTHCIIRQKGKYILANEGYGFNVYSDELFKLNEEEYENVDIQNNRLLIYSQDNKTQYQFIGSNGKLAKKINDVDTLHMVTDSVYAMKKSNGLCKLYNLDHNVIFIPESEAEYNGEKSSVIIVNYDRYKYGVISGLGEWIIKPHKCSISRKRRSGGFTYSRNSNTSLYNSKGQMIADSIRFADDHESHYYVEKSNKSLAIIKDDGTVIIDYQSYQPRLQLWTDRYYRLRDYKPRKALIESLAIIKINYE